MRSNPIAPWELRLVTSAYTFDIVTEPDPIVVVLAMGIKDRNALRIGKEAIEL
jgi:hypothetical protein